jgi:hypothetical protein
MVTNVKELSDSDKRLFRKKRHQLAKKINLKSIIKGVYILPFENPRKPSINEVEAVEQIEELLQEFRVGVCYFVATRIERPEFSTGGNPYEGGKLDMTKMKSYFILKPIMVDLMSHSKKTSNESTKKTSD